MLRSELMSLCQIIDHNDSARTIVELLGDLGICQLKDLNSDIAVYKRTFSDEVRRCDELNRKLNVVSEQLEAAGIVPKPRKEGAALVCDPPSNLTLQTNIDVSWRVHVQEPIHELDPQIRRVQGDVTGLKSQVRCTCRATMRGF